MNKKWSEMNKTMQFQIKKKETFLSGIDTLLKLREELMKQILKLKTEMSSDDFCAIPYMNAKGYGLIYRKSVSKEKRRLIRLLIS